MLQGDQHTKRKNLLTDLQQVIKKNQKSVKIATEL